MRQVHGRLSHEQILDPLHLGLLEQDLGQIIPFSVAKHPVAPQVPGHRLWCGSQWERCEDCELATNLVEVRLQEFSTVKCKRSGVLICF